MHGVLSVLSTRSAARARGILLTLQLEVLDAGNGPCCRGRHNRSAAPRRMEHSQLVFGDAVAGHSHNGFGRDAEPLENVCRLT